MNVSTNNANYGQVALTASLSKKRQVEQGQTALKLLESASTTDTKPATSSSSSGHIGSNINIKV